MVLRTPPKLSAGDRIHVIAPSRALSTICASEVEKASHRRSIARLESLGLRVTLGKHLWDTDPFGCPTVEHRLEDLHQAFADPDVAAVITVIGGWQANELLDRIDYDLIARNPKIFIGYSDITVLQGAFMARSQLVTYYGPHISTFGMKHGIDYTLEGFRMALMSTAPYPLAPSDAWSEDPWFADQETRNFIPNPGPTVLREGDAEGPIVGGNLSSFQLLAGTPYRPDIAGKLLFVEATSDIQTAARQLRSILQSPQGADVLGLALGRFTRDSGATQQALRHMVQSLPGLNGKPVVAGLDFGHTTPHATFPLGGRARIQARKDRVSVDILEH